MLTRRELWGRALAGVAASAAVAARDLRGAGRLAWSGPIGLQLYTVRDLFKKDPAGTLKQVAAIGYREVEISPCLQARTMKDYLRAAGLTAPTGHFEAPKNLEDWKKTVDQAHAYGVRYVVVGDNPHLGADVWKRRADLFNACGRLSAQAGIQFCYHNHFKEFERVDNTTGYAIMLKRCDPQLLKMEMDISGPFMPGRIRSATGAITLDAFRCSTSRTLRKAWPSTPTKVPRRAQTPSLPSARAGLTGTEFSRP